MLASQKALRRVIIDLAASGSNVIAGYSSRQERRRFCLGSLLCEPKLPVGWFPWVLSDVSSTVVVVSLYDTLHQTTSSTINVASTSTATLFLFEIRIKTTTTAPKATTTMAATILVPRYVFFLLFSYPANHYLQIDYAYGTGSAYTTTGSRTMFHLFGFRHRI